MTGPPVSHSCMALRKNGTLYIVETNVPGVTVKTYDQFIKDSLKENATIMWFQLSKDNSEKFNEEAVWKFFEEKKGLPYGISTFVPSGVDLPNGTLPSFMSIEFLPLIGTVLSKFEPSLTNLVIGDVLNARLNKIGLNFGEVSLLASEMNMKLEDMLAMPEKEEYKYPKNEQWICSALVIKMYMVAGILDAKIDPKEFVPKDIYQLNVFDKNFKVNKPKACRDADPDDDYCQIIGKYRVHAVNFSRFDAYPYMNNRCSMIPPNYFRKDNC